MERDYYREQEPSIEARELINIKKIDLILARLIETGVDLDPQVRINLRRLLQEYLKVLGLTSAEELFDLQTRLNIEWERELPPSTSTYPSKKDFQKRLLAVVLTDQKATSDTLPPVVESPTATAIAEFGRQDWFTVQGRNNQYTLDYLYELGKIMTSEAAYTALFPERDMLVVNREWGIENGVQRALVLRTLGTRFVTRNRMDSWVTARHSDVLIQ